MIILMDFAIAIIIREFLIVILTILFKKLYMYYFNFKIFILNDL